MMDRKNNKEIQKAIKEVFNNPNLPLYIYFNNFNFLISDNFMKKKGSSRRFKIEGNSKKARMMKKLRQKIEQSRMWKQKVHRLDKINMDNPSSYFDKLKQRIDDNKHNRDALWRLDLRRYFDNNKEEDINNLINRRYEKTDDMKKIEKRTHSLEKVHKEIFMNFEKDQQKHSLLKGPPMFYDDQNFENDGLIRFHNTMNRNLFNKRNYKLMKKFYTTQNFFRKKNAEMRPYSSNSNEEIENNVLNAEQVDYILEQRAYALKAMNDNLRKIKSHANLKEKLQIEKREPDIAGIIKKTKKRGISAQKKPNKRKFRLTVKRPSTRKRTPVASNKNFTISRSNTNSKRKPKKSAISKPKLPFLELDSMSKSSKTGIGRSGRRTPNTFKNAFGKRNFSIGYKQKDVDLSVSKNDIKNFESMIEKVQSLVNQYKGEELEEKLTLLYRVYQRMKKNAVDPKNNFFMNFKEKYEDPNGKHEVKQFHREIESKFTSHELYLDRILASLDDDDEDRQKVRQRIRKNHRMSFTSTIREEKDD